MANATQDSLAALGIELLQPLGRGRATQVFRGKCEGRDVAVKIFDGADAESLRRFRDEATTLARLNHPGVAKVYRFEEQDGFTWV